MAGMSLWFSQVYVRVLFKFSEIAEAVYAEDDITGSFLALGYPEGSVSRRGCARRTGPGGVAAAGAGRPPPLPNKASSSYRPACSPCRGARRMRDAPSARRSCGTFAAGDVYLK